MAQVAIIFGNGFDLDLGLKTRYSDFMKSPEFEEIYKNRRGIDPWLSLLEYLNKRAELENWFDMELAIHDYVLEHNDIATIHVDAIKEEFKILKDALCNYLMRISFEFKAQYDKLPAKFFNYLRYCKQTIAEIYFNYTFPREILGMGYYYNNYPFLRAVLYLLLNRIPRRQPSITYVHGNIGRKNIVLGCDIQSGEKVNRDLSFLYKYNMLKQANHVSKHLLEATEIIFYGHSVNEMDFCYFREFFKAASASSEPARHLTFITLDEKSERDIKDNIRNQDISVSELYNLEVFEFIHTSKIYNKEMEEIQKWNNMWRRLLGDDADKILRFYG